MSKRNKLEKYLFEKNISTTQQFNSKGYTFFGKTHQNRKKSDPFVPNSSYFETSETGGNKIRNFYNVNVHPSIKYQYSDDDINQIINTYKNYLTKYPFLNKYPYLNTQPIINSWSESTQEILKLPNFNIYKCLGKGIGTVHFYKTGSAIQGNELDAGTIDNNKTTNTRLTFGKPTSNYYNGPIYPFNGYIYAGTIVQLISQTNDDGIKETKVIPYQSGRGIPLYPSHYLPTNITPITSFASYGELTWPETGNTMSPSLSPGITPGESNAVVGVVLDSFSGTDNNRLFNTNNYIPEGFTESQLDNINKTYGKYYNHPAPQTISPRSFNNSEIIPKEQGYFSPGPNLSGTYYSPWPRCFAYQPNEPIPVLTKGITTVKIGAAYNIALTTYGIREKISSTDEQWIPVPCIPLFQGEQLQAGSYVYASVKGHIMTPGPYQNLVIPPDNDNPQTLVVPFGALGQTPWDHFADSLWSNIGWTGTPGLSFSNIPDQSNSILETLEDENGNRKVIDYLNQSNQGSIIVQGVTTLSVSPSKGNTFLQMPLDKTQRNLTDSEIYNIKVERTKIKGLSGRCSLPQSVPEKSKPIGVLLENVIGSGTWTYTGLPEEFDETNYEPQLVTGGVVYRENEFFVYRINVNIGGGVESNVLTPNQQIGPPELGAILQEGFEYASPPEAFDDGSILTAVALTVRNVNYFRYITNNASFIVENSGVDIRLIPGGSNYIVDNIYTAFNGSLNNISITYDTRTETPFLDSLGFTANDDAVDVSRYKINTVWRALKKQQPDFNQLGWFFTPTSLQFDGIVVIGSINDFKVSGRDVYTIYNSLFTYLQSEISNYDKLIGRPTVRILEVGDNGTVTNLEIIDYGAGNLRGDRCIVINGTRPETEPDVDNNCVFEFPGMPPGQQEIIACCGSYREFNGADPFYYKGFQLVTNTVIDPGLITVNKNDIQTSKNIPIVLNRQGPNFGISTNSLFHIGLNGINSEGKSFDYIFPRYHTYAYTIRRVDKDLPSGDEGGYEPHRGGTNYSSSKHVSTYNMDANGLLISMQVENGNTISHVSGLPYSYTEFLFDTSRYTFDATNGTRVRLLTTDAPQEYQGIVKLIDFNITDGLTIEIEKQGTNISSSDGFYIFQTQRIDQKGPTVEIITDSNNYVRQVILEDGGINNQERDIMLVTQENSDDNAIFLYNNNLPYIDLPPYARVPGYQVRDDIQAWERYSNIMKSATNLLDKEVLIELRDSDDQTMENIYPAASISSNRTPPSNDMYRHLYNY